MLFFYYPVILISILGYGFFVSNKIIKFKLSNLGYQGIVGIFSLLLISYISIQFVPHGIIFNLSVLLLGFFLFLFNFKKNITNVKNFKFYQEI